MRIYPEFHILLLELANPNILVQNKSPKLLSKKKYKVEKIADYNISINQYLIKWKNYD